MGHRRFPLTLFRHIQLLRRVPQTIPHQSRREAHSNSTPLRSRRVAAIIRDFCGLALDLGYLGHYWRLDHLCGRVAVQQASR